LQRCRRSLPGIAGIAIVALGLLGWALVSFGSVRDAWLYAMGARVFIEPRRFEVTDVRAGETRRMVFRLRNFTDRPLTVLGAETTCSCLSLEDKPPLVVPPKGTGQLRLTFALRDDAKGQFEGSMVYYTDDPSSPRLRAGLRIRVKP